MSDGRGGEATDGVVVVVQDVSAPQMTQPVASPPVLWPPNGKLVPVQIALAAADPCGAVACRITAVSSNEPATGDWLVTGDLTLDLRAKRLGTGSGRVYDVTVTCTDGAGNASSRIVKVTVPHNQ